MIPIAAAVALIVIGLLWLRPSTNSPFATVEIAGDSSYKVGEALRPGTLIQSGAQESVVWSFADGSRVEMRAQSRASLESSDDGAGLRLDAGSVLVSAAKQKPGKNLYVVTPDARVVVAGTVFLVEAQPAGSRVGVLEGVVQVRHGALTEMLRQGEQITTNLTIAPDLLSKSVSWSRNAEQLVAMVPPSPPIVSFTPAPPPRLTRTEVIPEPERSQDSPPAQPPTREPEPAPEEKQHQLNPEGAAGPEILARACTLCHDVQLATSLRAANREAYATMVEKQKPYGAPISGPESETLVDYLFKTYGAQKKVPRN